MKSHRRTSPPIARGFSTSGCYTTAMRIPGDLGALFRDRPDQRHRLRLEMTHAGLNAYSLLTFGSSTPNNSVLSLALWLALVR